MPHTPLTHTSYTVNTLNTHTLTLPYHTHTHVTAHTMHIPHSHTHAHWTCYNQRDEASKLVASLRHKTEERIDEVVR